MDRYNKMKQIKVLSEMNGFINALIKYEKTRGKDFGINFRFSRKQYNISNTTFWLGKINNIYFIGQKKDDDGEFKFFESEKLIQLYLHNQFEGLDQSWKGFWMNEVTTF